MNEYDYEGLNLSVGDFPFSRVSVETQGGKTLRETFFKADGSGVMVIVDYTHTEDGHK